MNKGAVALWQQRWENGNTGVDDPPTNLHSRLTPFCPLTCLFNCFTLSSWNYFCLVIPRTPLTGRGHVRLFFQPLRNKSHGFFQLGVQSEKEGKVGQGTEWVWSRGRESCGCHGNTTWSRQLPWCMGTTSTTTIITMLHWRPNNSLAVLGIILVLECITTI